MPDLDTLSRSELIAIILDQYRQIEELRAELEEFRRGGKRQAAPFSKGTRKQNLKRPGRKPGEGAFRNRLAPPLESSSSPPIAVPVAESCCPDCGGHLEPEPTETVSVTDLPPQPRPVVKFYHIEVKSCGHCGRKVRGRHSEIAPGQHGATAHRIGPRLMAAAQSLHYGRGIPVRKVPAILAELTGATLTQSAITQAALKQAEGAAGEAYQQLRDGIRQSPIVHTDDTGWRVNAETAHLMVFDTQQATVYQIRPQHRNEEVRELIPPDYVGVMVTDRGKSYEAEEFSEVAQQKCLSHLLRNVSEVVQNQQGHARKFGLRLKSLLQEAHRLWRDHREGKVRGFARKAKELDQILTQHLRPRQLKDANNQRLLDGIGLQHDRGRLLRFLEDPRVEPTNNRAERALRPAVIARKVSHCSKNRRGAEAFAVFTSLAQTELKRGFRSVTDAFEKLFRRTQPAALSP